AEQLDAIPRALDQPGLAQRGLLDRGAGVEALQLAHVHHREVLPVGRSEAELRQPPLQRALAALEAFEAHVPRAGLLAFAAAAGGLPRPGALLAAHPLLSVPAGLGAPEIGKGVHERCSLEARRARAASRAFTSRGFRRGCLAGFSFTTSWETR